MGGQWKGGPHLGLTFLVFELSISPLILDIYMYCSSPNN